MSDSIEYRLAELERRLINLLRVGTIEQADYEAARVKVRSGELLTDWRIWLTHRASNDIDWWAPEVGEQVLLFSPCGDPAQAVVLPGIYQDAHPAPETSKDVRRTVFADGTVVEYNRAASAMLIDCVGSLTLNCSGDITINSDGGFKVTAARIDLN